MEASAEQTLAKQAGVEGVSPLCFLHCRIGVSHTPAHFKAIQRCCMFPAFRMGGWSLAGPEGVWMGGSWQCKDLPASPLKQRKQERVSLGREEKGKEGETLVNEQELLGRNVGPARCAEGSREASSVPGRSATPFLPNVSHPKGGLYWPG